MVMQKSDLHCLLIQECGGELLDAVTDDRSSDSERVDRVRLPGLPFPFARSAHQRWPDPLARGDQGAFEPARNVPAVLQRADDLVAELAGETQRVGVPGVAGSDRSLPGLHPGCAVYGHERMRSLVNVHADHDHPHHPFPRGARTASGRRLRTVSRRRSRPRLAPEIPARRKLPLHRSSRDARNSWSRAQAESRIPLGPWVPRGPRVRRKSATCSSAA